MIKCPKPISEIYVIIDRLFDFFHIQRIPHIIFFCFHLQDDSDSSDSDNDDGLVHVPAVEIDLTNEQHELINANFQIDPSLYKNIYETKAVYRALRTYLHDMLNQGW